MRYESHLLKRSLSLVIPIYNEAENIERTLRVADEVLEKISSDYELILVDDASTDETPQILDRLARSNPKIRVERHSRNRKLGGSLKTGFSKATKDIVVYSDADLPFDFHDIERAVHVIQTVGADIVAAYRHDRTSDRWYRIVYTLVYNWLIRLLYGIRIRDVNFAFKTVKREVLQQIPLKAEGSFINAELLIRAERMGFYICQIGVDYFVRRVGQSTLASPGVILKIIREMLCLYPELVALKRK